MARMSEKHLGWALGVLFLFFAQSAAAQETGPPRPEDGILSLSLENDMVAGTDRDYTHG